MFLDKFIDAYKKKFNIETLGADQDEMDVIIWALNTGQTLQISTSMYYVDDEEEEVSDGKGDAKVDVPDGSVSDAKVADEGNVSDGEGDDKENVSDGEGDDKENVSDGEGDDKKHVSDGEGDDNKNQITKAKGHYEHNNYKEIPQELRDAIDSSIDIVMDDPGQGGSHCEIGVFELRGHRYFIYTNSFHEFYNFAEWDYTLSSLMTYEKYHNTMAISSLDITLTAHRPSCIDWTKYDFSKKV